MWNDSIQASRLAGIVREIAAGVADPADLASAAADALRIASEGLDANGSALFLFDEGESVLVPAAVYGHMSAFLRDIAPLEISVTNEIARVFLTGQPVYVADIYEHTPLSASESGNGVGRWRSAITTESHAVLPLNGRSRRLGALTLQWAGVRDFAPDEVTLLESVADAIALVLERAEGAGGTLRPARIGAPEPEEDLGAGARAAPPEPPQQSVTVVSPDGTLRPLPDAENETWAATFAISLERAPGGAAHPRRAFFESFRIAEGAVGFVAGSARLEPSRAEDFVNVLGQALRVHALSGHDPAQALERSERVALPCVGESALPHLFFGVLGLDEDALHFRNAGLGAPLVLCRDGRVKTLGASVGTELLLPGDTLVVHEGAGTVDELRGRVAGLYPLAGARIPERLRDELAVARGGAPGDDILLLAATRYAT